MASTSSNNAEKQHNSTTTTTVVPIDTSTRSSSLIVGAPSSAMQPPITVPVAPSGEGEASGSTSSERKHKKGRGKVQMRRMEKETNLLVTFSKRKFGLFKKANEICTLCGVQCAVVIFSPAGKVFSFGHPSVDAVIDRYLNGNIINPVPLRGDQEPQNHQPGANNNVEELVAEITDLMAGLESAKKNSQRLDKRKEERVANCWWGRPVQQMDGEQLDTIKRAMEDLRSKVYEQVGLSVKTSASSFSSPSALQWFHQNYSNFHGGGGTPTFAGFPSWANNHEAGSSGHAFGGWAGGGSP